MLIGGDDISNDVITLGTCFSMFVYICAHFCFALIGGNRSLGTLATWREKEGDLATMCLKFEYLY